MRDLIIYFSRKGENYVNGQIVQLTKGNTEKVVDVIASVSDCNLFKIETVNAYSDNYKECVRQAMKEYQTQARPALKQYLEDVSSYHKIILAGPNWVGTYPMAMFSEIEHLNLLGKHVYLVITHEGGGMANALNDVRKIAPHAIVEEGLVLRGGEVESKKNDIIRWTHKHLLT